jgi:hypothetical protein
MEFLASPDLLVKDAGGSYTAPKDLPPNQFAFFGDWQVMAEYSNPSKGAQLLLNFDAKEVFLVMRPKDENNPGKLKVYLDDKLISQTNSAGVDIKDSIVTVDTDRLYKLINLPSHGRHILKLEFLDANTEVYAFTFG